MCRYDGNYESSSFQAQTDVKRARTTHTCDECRTTIQPGESYRRYFVVTDGSGDCYKACRFCADEAIPWLCKECGGWVFTEVFRELVEHLHEGYYGAGRLAVRMRRRFRKPPQRRRHDQKNNAQK